MEWGCGDGVKGCGDGVRSVVMEWGVYILVME